MLNPQALIEKIQALPRERIAEIEDFVDFVTAREQERAFSRPRPRQALARSRRCGAIRRTTPTTRFDFGDVVMVGGW